MTWDRAAAHLLPRLWYARVAGALMWGAWVGGLILSDGGFDPLGQVVSADHLAFTTAARLVRDGRDGDIYHYAEVEAYQHALFGGRFNSLEAFRNPPFYALLYVPTAGLSYTAGALMWDAVAVVCLVLGVRWLGAGRPWRAAGWAATFLPVFAVCGYGQNSLLSFAILAGTYRLLSRGRPFAAGLAAGLLWFKPPLLIGLVVWGVLDARRLWPAAAGAVVTGAVLVGASYPLVPDAWAEFVHGLGANVRFDNFEWWKAHGPRAFWRLLLPGEGLGPLRTGLTLLTVAAGLAAFVQVWRARRDDTAVLFGAAVALTLWASPHVMIYEWAVAVVPAVLWWERVPHARPAWVVLFAAMWVAFFTATDMSRGVDWAERHWLGRADPVLFQYSVPVAGWVGWRASRLLISTKPNLSPQRHEVHTKGTQRVIPSR